jgi:hypothetical protein
MAKAASGVHYKRYRTPLETLLDHPAQHLRPGLSVNALKRVAAVRKRHGRGQAHATGQGKALRTNAVHRLRCGTEEMTMWGKASAKDALAFPHILEIDTADFQIPSAPAATASMTKSKLKGVSPSSPGPSPSSGSSFDWKRPRLRHGSGIHCCEHKARMFQSSRH